MENDSALKPYRNGFENRESILTSIRKYSGDLLPVSGLDANRFLAAIAIVETSFGADNRARYESAYDDMGTYGRRSENLQASLKEFGALAACSYGPWQLLYIVAKEHGFMGHPIELFTAETSLPYVIRIFNVMIYKGAASLEALADGWNSGSFSDANRPAAYLLKVKKAYESLPTL